MNGRTEIAECRVQRGAVASAERRTPNQVPPDRYRRLTTRTAAACLSLLASLTLPAPAQADPTPLALTVFEAPVGNVRVGLSRHMPAPGLHVTGHEFRHKTTGSHPAIWTPKSGVCGRTEQVRAAIMSAVGVSDCAAVTTAQLTGVGSLDFTRMDITSLQPDDFSGLTNLRILYLDQNKLSSLPAGVFSDLTALRVLSLGTNALSSLPDGVFSGLTALEWLWLGQNDLSSLPDSVFSDLTALESLFLFSNNLSSLPDSVFSGLTALRFLDLLFNELNSLPAGVFSGLAALEVLYLAYNELSSLPDSVFSGLTRLQQLQLQDNELSSLPDGVFSDLTALWLLYLNQNEFSSLPDGVLSGLTRLQHFHLNHNTVDPFPLAVTLEKVGSDQVRAKVLAGAPFAVGIPVTVANGALDGGPTTLRVAAGSVEGTPVTVTRKAGTKAAVTVDIDLTTQPSLPTDHYGYIFRKVTSGSPTSILPAMNTAAAGAPTITGTPQVGAELTASASGISDVDGLADAHFAYQWIRADGDISGATGSTYTMVAADEDKRLKVRISFTDDAGNAESLTSAAMAPVWPAPANPPLEDGEEELLSTTMTLGWHQFPLWVAGYGRVRGESFGEMDVTSFEDGGATYTIDAFLVNSRGVFGLATGSTRPDASGLVAYWNGYRISELEAYTSNSGKSPPMLMGRTPQPSTEYSRYEGGASDGIRVAVSLRRAGPPDEPSAVSVSDAGATEGDAVEFTVSLSAASARQVTVEYGTSDGTAESGTDYTAASGTLAFAAGETSKTVSVATADDSADEEDETFTLTLSNPADATLGNATATGTIVDDDESAPLTAEFRDMPETHDGETAFRFRVAFSEPIAISFRSLREDAFTVAGGRVTSGKRVDGRKDLFRITVEPDSAEDVTIALPAGRDCEVSGAICTWGPPRKQLTNSPSATVEGPVNTAATVPRITAVEVTSVPELERHTYGRGETIRFTVSFSERVEVTGKPHFTFSLGNRGAARRVDAPYESGSGTAALVFGYVVQEGDEDDNGIFLVDGDALDAGEAITALGGGVDADLSSSVRGTERGHKVDGSRAPAASAPMREDLAARACSALAGGDGLAPGAAAAALWRDGDMDNDQLAALDGMGNGNGTYDLGDLLAWINRCQPGSGLADGAGPPPSAPPAMPVSQSTRGASQRRKGARGPARRRRTAADPPAAGSRTRRSGWLRTALLAVVALAWGCGDGIVAPHHDAARDGRANASALDPGPLHVRLTAPPQARDIGAMLVVEGPAIDSLQAPGLEMFETNESSSTRREVVIAGALPPDAPVLRVWVPHRGDHARYRVRLLQVAAEDFTLGDLSVYGSVISR